MKNPRALENPAWYMYLAVIKSVDKAVYDAVERAVDVALDVVVESPRYQTVRWVLRDAVSAAKRAVLRTAGQPVSGARRDDSDRSTLQDFLRSIEEL